MIWFNIKKLEKQVASNKLTDKDGFQYLLAYLILTTIVVSFLTNTSNPLVKLLTCVGTVGINIWGLNAANQLNAEIDSKDFLKRFLALNWVIGMRLIVASLVVALVSEIFFTASKPNLDEASARGILGMVLSIGFSFVNYLLILKSFNRVRSLRQNWSNAVDVDL